MDNDTSAADVRKMLEPNGVQVEIIDQVLYKGMPVSSTRIRELLLSGNIEEVNQMLGRPYTLCVEGCIEGPQPQIVPGQGKYNAIIATNGAGTVNSLIEVKNGSIHFCNEEANAHPVQEIQFLKKVS
jgi:hypothetical protein